MTIIRNKIIWSYWEGDTNDVSVKCLKSWYKYAPDWDIRILGSKDLSKYNFKLPSNFDKLSITMKSDLIRLNLLYLYGGIWLDATILLKEDLSWLVKFTNKYSPKKYFAPRISNIIYKSDFYENWFIVSPQRHNKDILKILNIMVRILEYFPDHHMAFVYNTPCNFNIVHELKGGKSYFLMYQIFCYLIKNDKDFNKPIQLPINTMLSLFPLDLPFETKKLYKYVNAGKFNIYLICLIFVIILLLLLLVFTFTMLIK